MVLDCDLSSEPRAMSSAKLWIKSLDFLDFLGVTFSGPDDMAWHDPSQSRCQASSIHPTAYKSWASQWWTVRWRNGSRDLILFECDKWWSVMGVLWILADFDGFGRSKSWDTARIWWGNQHRQVNRAVFPSCGGILLGSRLFWGRCGTWFCLDHRNSNSRSQTSITI